MNVPKLRFKEFTDEWQKVKISSFVNESKRKTGDIKKYPLWSLTIENGVTPKTDRYERSFLVKKEDNYKIVYPNYYVYNPMNAHLGAIARNKSDKSISVSGYYDIFSINNDYYGFYDNYFISPVMFKKYKLISSGSLLEKQRVHYSQFKELKIYLPSDKEQEKIAKLLSLLDKKIALQTKKIETLKLFKKGLLNELLKCNSCSKIPLKHILKERKEYSTKAGNLPHVTLSKNGIEEKTERYNRDFLVKSKNKKYKTTKIYDLCYNPANLKFGVICLNTYGSAIFSPIYITFEINHKFNPLYIGYYVTQQNFINSARKYEQGTVYERMAVAPEDFLKMNIYVPNKYIQDKFSTILIFMDKKLNNENEKLKKLEALKKGFMQNMFV